MGPLEVTWSNSPAKAGHPRASCSGPCPDGFGTSPRSKTPQPPWVTCASACPPSPSDVQREPPVFQFVSHCLLSPHWAPLKTAWLHPAMHAPFRYLYTLIRFPPEPSLLQAEQSQLSQPFLIGEMHRTLHHLHGPLLNSIQYVHVRLVLRSPELDATVRVWPHQYGTEDKDHFPQPASSALSDASQDTIRPLCSKGALLAHVQPSVQQDQVPFRQAAFQMGGPQQVRLPGVILTQVQDFSPYWTSCGSCQPISDI